MTSPTQGEHAQPEAPYLQLADLLASGQHLVSVERKEAADAIRTLHAQVAALTAAPAEWPTNEMIEAGRRAAATHGPLLGNGQSLWHVFRDMLAAAPAQPAEGGAYVELEKAAQVCESRSRSLSRDGNHIAANEAKKCAGAIRASRGQAPAGALQKLADAQEPLGAEFEKVLHDNLPGLYAEADTPTAQPAPAAGAVAGPLNSMELMKAVMQADEALAGRCTRGTTNWAAAIGEAVQSAVLQRLWKPEDIAAAKERAKKFKPWLAAAPTPAAQGDAGVLEDAARLDWLEADESERVFHLGKNWYTRPSYGMPYRKRASLRAAIDAAIAQQKAGE